MKLFWPMSTHCEQALRHPLAIERNGHALVMMTSASANDRLAELDHRAILSADMSYDDAEGMCRAEVFAESIALNSHSSSRAI